jgi:hypothetical protein
MNIQEFKKALLLADTIRFVLPNNKTIPAHFHITEMGLITKNYIDCGNTIRTESLVSFQIWCAEDYEHRLNYEKCIKIINAASRLFKEEHLEIEIEYQTDLSIGKFGLSFDGKNFHLVAKNTTCLAQDSCGIKTEKSSCCSATSNCC